MTIRTSRAYAVRISDQKAQGQTQSVRIEARSASEAIQRALKEHPGCVAVSCTCGTPGDTGRWVSYKDPKTGEVRGDYVGGWQEFEVPPHAPYYPTEKQPAIPNAEFGFVNDLTPQPNADSHENKKTKTS
jgi:hypothetical protein